MRTPHSFQTGTSSVLRSEDVSRYKPLPEAFIMRQENPVSSQPMHVRSREGDSMHSNLMYLSKSLMPSASYFNFLHFLSSEMMVASASAMLSIDAKVLLGKMFLELWPRVARSFQLHQRLFIFAWPWVPFLIWALTPVAWKCGPASVLDLAIQVVLSSLAEGLVEVTRAI